MGALKIVTSAGAGAVSDPSSLGGKEKKRKFKSNHLVPEEWALVVNDGAPPSKGKKSSETSGPHALTLSNPSFRLSQPVSDHTLSTPDSVRNNEVNGLENLEQGNMDFSTESGVQHLPPTHLEVLHMECKETPNETPAEWVVNVPEVLSFGNCKHTQFSVPQDIPLLEGENIGITPILESADKTVWGDGGAGVVDMKEDSMADSENNPVKSVVHVEVSPPLPSTDPNVIAIRSDQEAVERAEVDYRTSKAPPVVEELIPSAAPDSSEGVAGEIEPLQVLQMMGASDPIPATSRADILKAQVEERHYQSLSQEEPRDEDNIVEEGETGVANPSAPLIPAEELKRFLESNLGVKLDNKLRMALENWHDLPLIIRSVRHYIGVIREAKNYGTAEYLRIIKFHKKCLSHQASVRAKALPNTQ